MKKMFLILTLLAALPMGVWAQDDDVYFIPSKKTAPERTTPARSAGDAAFESEAEPLTDTYTDSEIDAYNRRGAEAPDSSYAVDTAASDVGSMTQRLIRFHAPEVNVYVSSPYYWDYCYDPIWTYSSAWWPSFGWSLTWGYGWGPYCSIGWYDPFYRPYWGWYDPWWHGPGWHRPLPPPRPAPGWRPGGRGGRTIAGYTGQSGRGYGTFGRTSRTGRGTLGLGFQRPSNNFGQNTQRRSGSWRPSGIDMRRPSQQKPQMPLRTYNNSNRQPSRPSGQIGNFGRPSSSTRSMGAPVISSGGRSYGGGLGGGMRGGFGGGRGGRR